MGPVGTVKSGDGAPSYCLLTAAYGVPKQLGTGDRCWAGHVEARHCSKRSRIFKVTRFSEAKPGLSCTLSDPLLQLIRLRATRNVASVVYIRFGSFLYRSLAHSVLPRWPGVWGHSCARAHMSCAAGNLLWLVGTP